MNSRIMILAAAAAITLGAAGAASAATNTGAPSFEAPAMAKTQLANHRGRFSGYRGRFGFRYFGRRRGGNSALCRKLYYLGFVLGDYDARRMYYKRCMRRPISRSY
jgi:hypothetical protein